LLVKEAKGDSSDSKYSRPVYDAISSWQIYHFHDTSATSAMRHYEIVQDNKVLRFDAANLAPYLLVIVVNRKDGASIFDRLKERGSNVDWILGSALILIFLTSTFLPSKRWLYGPI
jgi:predicted ATPase